MGFATFFNSMHDNFTIYEKSDWKTLHIMSPIQVRFTILKRTLRDDTGLLDYGNHYYRAYLSPELGGQFADVS